jgi:ribokinase
MSKKIITVLGTFAVGMTMRTSRMPIFGETLIGSDFDMGPGGKGSNQAVATARLGAESCFLGIIGEDNLGKIATDLFQKEGINTRYLKKTQELPTPVGFIILNPQGNNGIVIDYSTNKLMDEAFVDTAEDQIARSDMVLSVLEIPVHAAARAMQLGRKHHVRTLLNPAPATALPDDLFPMIDVITPNETELRILMGLPPDDPTPTPELARQLQARGAKTIVVTMGEEGALVLTSDNAIHVPSVKVDVVDTTGAGDAFTSGLAVALAEGKELITAVQYGVCSGALACTHLGVIPSLAYRSDVEALYRANFQ